LQISNELKKAIISSLLGKYSLYIVQIVSLMILARLFTPEEFGVVAAAQVFLMFFQMLAISGLAPAVVYQEVVPSVMRDGVFSFTFILGLLLALLFLLAAKPLYYWFEFETGLFVFLSLPVCVFFSALAMMPVASLQKDAKFVVIARAEILSEIIAFVVCICLSFYIEGIIALAFKFILVPILRFIFYYVFSEDTTIGRPKIGKEIKQVIALYDYAKYQVAFNILNFFSRNLDNVLIAKFFGAGLLGVYEKTYQIMRYPLQLFTFAITPALQPVLTKYKTQPDVVYKEFSVVAVRLALVGLFSATIMYWHAADIIFILFGNQWFAAVDFLKVLSLSIPLQMVTSSTGGVFQAFGATKAMFKCGVFSSIVTISAISIGIYNSDILLICYLLVLAFLVNYIQCFYMLHRTVFEGQNIKKIFIISVLTFLVFLNLFFKGSDGSPVGGYVESVFSIALSCVYLLFPVVIIYLFLKKNSN